MPHPQAASAAVLGSPISHSKSPQLHSAAYQFLGVELDYTRIEVAEPDVEAFLSGRGADSGWAGWSVTMPLKAAMVPQMTTVSQRAQTLGVLNTVTVEQDTSDGRTLHGENTDVDGIITALREQGVRHSPAADSDSRSVSGAALGIVGAGGTAAAALAAAAELGFAEVVIYARSAERAQAALPLGQRLGLTVRVESLETLGSDLAQGRLDVVISTVPPRAADSLAEQLPADSPGSPVLLDVAYDPWPSVLAEGWQKRGWGVTSGLDMLLHQAVKQVEFFTADTPNPAAALNDADHALMVEAMREAIGLPLEHPASS